MSTCVLWILFILLWILFCRDVLPFPLELPEAIIKATTHRQLEAISHMGQGTVSLGPVASSLTCPEKDLSSYK